MSEDAQQNPRRMHFGLLLLISFALFNLGYIVDQTVRWSNHVQGLVNGAIHIFVFGIAWCFYLLPWSLAIFALYRWRKWKRFRTQWVLGPAVLALITSIGGLLFQPATPSRRFKNLAKTELPSNAQNLRYHFEGGGIADYNDTYYFETTPDEIERIIADMGLSEDRLFGSEGLRHTPISPLPSGPDFWTWEGAKQYQGWDQNQHWFYYMITDASHTRAYVLVGCI
ncbi:MAG: hypothetical protein EOP83_01490 [Verrucomicrobiaceae bacterium]|nr:MAG: hypothetical protein EOP83_01490 [Verrucomicrobiaceae bacterium]